MPENTVSVCRPGPWGNPYIASECAGGAADAVELFDEWLDGCWPNTEPARRDWILRNLHLLSGKNLACFCKPGTPCHADVLIRLANSEFSGV